MTDDAGLLAYACPDHTVRGRPAHDSALYTATRMLEKRPSLARASFQSAIACGEVDAVRRALDERPGLAREKGGPKHWEPLLYLAFTRLHLPAARDNAVRMAELLLERGADANASFKAGDSDYTALVGVIGEGEEDRPPHARRDDLTRLLLDRGAEPYDKQVVYNVHFHARSVPWWLALMHEHSIRRGRDADWRDPEWRMLDMKPYGCGARWHLWIAIEHGDIALARWCLEHGASPTAPPASDPRFSKRTLYQDALLFAQPEIADLLARHGAARDTLTGEDAFTAACRRGDAATARALAREHPAYPRSPLAMALAAKENRVDMLEQLAAMGASPAAAAPMHGTPLHEAAYAGARDAAAWLVEHGADVDAREPTYHATPLGWAVHGARLPVIELLAPRSRDLGSLVYLGDVDRVRDILRGGGAGAALRGERESPLTWLPNDDDRAAEIARLLLEHGADPGASGRDGRTAAEIADRRQLDGAAAVIRDALRGSA